MKKGIIAGIIISLLIIIIIPLLVLYSEGIVIIDNNKSYTNEDFGISTYTSKVDKDGDGYIGFDDFYRIMKKRGDDPLEDWSDDDD